MSAKVPGLEALDSGGVGETSTVQERDFPSIQPILQKRIWDRLQGRTGTDAAQKAIEALRKEDGRFHMEGGSWTNNLWWVKGYGNVLSAMEQASALFAEKTRGVSTSEQRYRNALYYLLMTQTSCFRYWGGGTWTDYARELCRRTVAILQHDF